MKFIQKRLTVGKEKKLEKVYYRILVGLMILGILYYLFLEPKSIGHDNRYFIYIFLLPTILGLFILAVCRRQFLMNKFSTNRGVTLWIFLTIFYLIQGSFFSYLSLGQIAKISWDILNNRVAKQNVEEVFDCKITKFWAGKYSSNIDFIFKDHHNKFDVQYTTIEEYLHTSPEEYYLKITARKGIWDYYLVESWIIYKKTN
ncbi:hypothetical protein EG240_11850 [Paenimyroides tangerinum]|uniref:Uncharacterized protein n=1 Tax=Paenimyroides tangerinum TaxID=2488728 RepID=A0A3P3W2N9_9FLAO|nr:hypothetical protein [Paenimyroides tangerinum]RRJ89325.1 hypothetical protein EG240_11850 [Paenimyroides tangerinum]